VCSSIKTASFSVCGIRQKLFDFAQIEIFYDPNIAIVSGDDTDLLEIELIEAEQVEGKYV
jgi:hypothetical protein